MLQIINLIILLVKKKSTLSKLKRTGAMEIFITSLGNEKAGSKVAAFSGFHPKANTLRKSCWKTQKPRHRANINSHPSFQLCFLCCWCWPTGVSWIQQTRGTKKGSHRGLTTLGTETHLPRLTNVVTSVQLYLSWVVGCTSTPSAPGTHTYGRVSRK